MFQLQENFEKFMLRGDKQLAPNQKKAYDFLFLANFYGLKEAVNLSSNFKDWFEVRENSQRCLKSFEDWGF